MGGFKLLEHTADVGIASTGQSLEEALAWLAIGVFSLIVDPDGVLPRDCRQISVSSRDQQALVVDWLNELLYLYEAEGFLPKECEVSVHERRRTVSTNPDAVAIQARCLGEPLDPARHHILSVVKAATYHGLQITHNGHWRIQVILDI